VPGLCHSAFHIAFLCAVPLLHGVSTGAKGAPNMADSIAVILGFGIIMVMAAYAELCERI
jgi:hypothetical protein